MPTGYTAAVKDGISFEQFTWDCARAFGALIEMREEPPGTPIPEAFEPSGYYAQSLASAISHLAALKAMNADEASAAAVAEHAAATTRAAERLAAAQSLRNKYSEMLAKVVKWQPPTPDHQGLKDFMAEQLRQSIDFDCATGSSEQPPLLDGPAWLTEAIAVAEQRVKYHRKAQADEVARIQQRNSWIKALRESVPPPAP